MINRFGRVVENDRGFAIDTVVKVRTPIPIKDRIAHLFTLDGFLRSDDPLSDAKLTTSNEVEINTSHTVACASVIPEPRAPNKAIKSASAGSGGHMVPARFRRGITYTHIR
jgi:hypothetical protein